MERSRMLTTVGVIALLVASTGLVVCSQPDNGDDRSNDSQPSHDDSDAGDNGDANVEPPPDCEADDDEPLGLILTWQNDPTSTMTIDWHTDHQDPRTSICVRNSDQDQWSDKLQAQRHDVPHLDRDLYRIELTGLDPDTEYVFQAGDYQREFRFRTMPTDIDDRSVTFASGGDLRDNAGAQEGWFEKTNEMVMEFDLDFIVWGGDLAYADGGELSDHRERWTEFLQEKLDTLVYDNGRVVPVLVAIGNHEVRQGYQHRYSDYEQTDEWRQREAPYFFSLFAFPGQPGYGVLDFDDYLSLIVLDSRHANPIHGQQADWLESTLQQRADDGIDHILPFFHYPAYPSKSPYDEPLPEQIRTHWIPLFEDHGIEVAFQHKDHVFMRTYPLRDGEIDHEDGIVYLGNGNWGAALREWMTEVDWYAQEFVSVHHAYLTTLQGQDIYIRAVDQEGQLLDEYGDEIP